MTLKEYFDLCNKHSWHDRFSSSSRYYEDEARERLRLEGVALLHKKETGDDSLERVYEAFENWANVFGGAEKRPEWSDFSVEEDV